MPRVAIINGYLRENAGDAALLAVILQHIQQAAPQAERAVFGMENPKVHAEFAGCRNFGSIRRYVADGEVPRGRRIARRLAALFWGMVLAFGPRILLPALLRVLPPEVQSEVRHMVNSDLVVSMGGGYLRGGPGLNGKQNVFFIVLPILIAHRHGTPVAFAPQSFGPFVGWWQRWLVRSAVGRAGLVLAREDESLPWLIGCRLPDGLVRRGVDSGFDFAPATAVGDVRARWQLPRDIGLVGVTSRTWLPATEQLAYEQALAELIDYVQRDLGMAAVLIPQVTCQYLGDDDRISEQRIANLCATPPYVIREQPELDELFALYGELELLVGTRFHSVIFSLTQGVPALAIAYEHKTTGIMQDLGLANWVVPIERVASFDMRGLLSRLLAERAEYRRQLGTRLPPYAARARQTSAQLRTLLRASGSAGLPVQPGSDVPPPLALPREAGAL